MKHSTPGFTKGTVTNLLEVVERGAGLRSLRLHVEHTIVILEEMGARVTPVVALNRSVRLKVPGQLL